MQLSAYFCDPDSLSPRQLAEQIGVRDVNQVRQWQHGYSKRVPGPAYCVAIERATAGVVTRRDLRPDDWESIWPELAVPGGAQNLQPIEPVALGAGAQAAINAVAQGGA